MLIEIKGVQFVNKGAELMLSAILTRIREYWPEADIVLEGSPLSPYKARAKTGAYQKLSLRKNVLDLNGLTDYLPKALRRYLKRWGIVTEADIDIVLDASGFAYGDQWGAMVIRHLSGELNRAAERDRAYIFLPQALGPFTRKQDAALLKRSLPLATLISARDDVSHTQVKHLTGPLSQLRQYPDFTNAVSGVVPDYWQEGQQKVVFIPNSQMVSDKNNNTAWKANYLRIFGLLIETVEQQGLQAVLLNHEGAGDRQLCEQLNSRFDNRLELIEEEDPLMVKGIIGQSRAIVCSRFHGCVSALSQGVVALGTSWSHKYEHLYQEYNVPELLLTPDIEDQALTELLADALTDDNSYTPKITEMADGYKQQTEAMWAEVKQLVNKQMGR